MADINIPNHIAIIMDGNRRWAKSRMLPVSAGHRAGGEALRKLIEHLLKIGVKVLTVYAFSTENWSRSKEEVDDLMNLMREYLDKIEKDNNDRNVKIKIIGNIKRLDEDLQQRIINLENKTKNNDALIFNIALNYGGRDEIVNAVKDISKDFSNKDIEEINEDIFSKYLYTKDVVDPDMIIRTAGEKRLSNFLLWQAAYAEFVYTDVLWPDFDAKELDAAIIEFNKRNRKYGGK